MEYFINSELAFFNDKWWYFPSVCSRHILWVLVRTASSRPFTFCFWTKIRILVFFTLKAHLSLHKAGFFQSVHYMDILTWLSGGQQIDPQVLAYSLTKTQKQQSLLNQIWAWFFFLLINIKISTISLVKSSITCILDTWEIHFIEQVPTPNVFSKK